MNHWAYHEVYSNVAVYASICQEWPGSKLKDKDYSGRPQNIKNDEWPAADTTHRLGKHFYFR